ncbi:MAG: hypothetical protein ABDH21_05255 [bacterium]
MECRVSTPYFSKILKIRELKIDTGEGELIIYPYHTDFMSSINKNSMVVIKTIDNEIIKYKCKQGVIKIQSNSVLVLIDTDEKHSL